MTCVEQLFELGREAIEKREHADIDCDKEWLAYHAAREEILGERASRGVLSQAPLSLARPSLELTDSAIELVASDPTKEHRVGTFECNDWAYRHRVKWTQRGYDARTERIRPGEYAVLVKGSPK